jgi:hypothetical protein
VVIDADTVLPLEPAEHTLVELGEVVTFRAVASVHVDDEEAEGDVAAARGVWSRAGAGDPDAVAVLERCLDHELGWFAAQEIGSLIGI